ncbi:MAG: hypothetical protein ABI239_01095 [Aquihabitans sp.]
MALPSSDRPVSSATKGVIPAEWPAQAADLIVDNIAKVRDKTTRPALVISRGLVYGLLTAVVGTIAFILLLIMVIRAYDNWVPGNIWPLYAGLAVIFSVGGIVMLGRANRPAPADV